MLVGFNFRSVFSVLLLALILYFQYRFWVGEGSLADLSSVRQELQQRSSENDLLIERNQLLAEEVKALKSGTAAIEQRARTELGMVKENETFYLIIDEKASFKE